MGEYMESIYSITYSKLEEFLLSNNEKKFHATQIIDWLYVKRVSSFKDMTNLSKDLIGKLEENFFFDKLEIVKSKKILMYQSFYLN